MMVDDAGQDLAQPGNCGRSHAADPGVGTWRGGEGARYQEGLVRLKIP